MLHGRILRYLDEVARAGSIRAAAQRLNIASSAVNRQILSLEQELGAKLFERLHKRLRLTAAGEVVLTHVRRTLEEQRRTLLIIDDMKGLRRGSVRIVTMQTVAASILPPVVAAFRERHPGVTVQVTVLTDLESALLADEADLGIGINPKLRPGLRVYATATMRFGAVVHPGHPLATRQRISLRACAEYPLIIPAEGFSIRKAVDAAIAPLKERANIAVSTDSIDLMKLAAMAGTGVSFLMPINVRQEILRGELAYIPLSDNLGTPETLCVIHRERDALVGLPAVLAEALAQALLVLAEAS